MPLPKYFSPSFPCKLFSNTGSVGHLQLPLQDENSCDRGQAIEAKIEAPMHQASIVRFSKPRILHLPQG